MEDWSEEEAPFVAAVAGAGQPPQRPGLRRSSGNASVKSSSSLRSRSSKKSGRWDEVSETDSGWSDVYKDDDDDSLEDFDALNASSHHQHHPDPLNLERIAEEDVVIHARMKKNGSKHSLDIHTTSNHGDDDYDSEDEFWNSSGDWDGNDTTFTPNDIDTTTTTDAADTQPQDDDRQDLPNNNNNKSKRKSFLGNFLPDKKKEIQEPQQRQLTNGKKNGIHDDHSDAADEQHPNTNRRTSKTETPATPDIQPKPKTRHDLSVPLGLHPDDDEDDDDDDGDWNVEEEEDDDGGSWDDEDEGDWDDDDDNDDDDKKEQTKQQMMDGDEADTIAETAVTEDLTQSTSSQQQQQQEQEPQQRPPLQPQFPRQSTRKSFRQSNRRRQSFPKQHSRARIPPPQQQSQQSSSATQPQQPPESSSSSTTQPSRTLVAPRPPEEQRPSKPPPQQQTGNNNKKPPRSPQDWERLFNTWERMQQEDTQNNNSNSTPQTLPEEPSMHDFYPTPDGEQESKQKKSGCLGDTVFPFSFLSSAKKKKKQSRQAKET
ncbi:expressed unknown protein [Seminavis robusta]|uniref:Uncharacterized protein n=1 Tax=Seminavis robusta TaxID=568900 RepID=A0A9N8DJL6_9STRA|nr:expressed unknown protein [Seminavis robusta]|eukprot:Sro122_g059080.1 n/a (541) ;mRNA; f:16761-18383